MKELRFLKIQKKYLLEQGWNVGKLSKLTFQVG